MTPVDQIAPHQDHGDCLRASVASLFDLRIEQVPNFMLFEGDQWWHVCYAFIWALGYEFDESQHPKEAVPLADEAVNGYTLASVPSRNYENRFHSVVIDLEGNVAHDPDPHKHYQGENIIKSGAICYFDRFIKRVEE